MDVPKEGIAAAVMNGDGKVVMESIIETKASTIPQCIQGRRDDSHVTLEDLGGLAVGPAEATRHRASRARFREKRAHEAALFPRTEWCRKTSRCFERGNTSLISCFREVAFHVGI
jgi:hypothetical protein